MRLTPEQIEAYDRDGYVVLPDLIRPVEVELLRTEVVPHGDHNHNYSVELANTGYLPAYVTQRALDGLYLRGVMFEMHLPDSPEISLVSGKERMEGPQLEGHAPKQSQLAFLANRQVTADRAVAEWVVRAPVGTRLALSASAERAGVVRTEVVLD